ncbi:MAG: efflux RND transporter periplasmic adaptor subunit [Chitinophagaceae bacterium]
MSKYDQIQQTAAASRERYTRLKEAAKEPGAVAPLELDMAQARMKADEAAVQSEKANLFSSGSINKYLTITAPFDGIIVQRNVSEGALVGGNKASDPPMFILEASGKLRLEVMIPEDYVDKIDSKHPVSFSFNALTGKTFTAQISRMAKALGSERSEAIEIDVPNAQQLLKAGMYAEVDIPLSSPTQSLIVPSSAIVRSTERMYVVTEKSGKAHLVDVREGLRKSDSSEIFGQLSGGIPVMLHPTDDIKENEPIH